MNTQLIKALIDALAESELSELEYSNDGETLRLVKRAGERAAAAVPAASKADVAPAPSAEDRPEEFSSPLYGVIHLRPSPDAQPFVTEGEAVRAGQTLCVIEAMKVFTELRADRDATLHSVLVESGQEVEAGQPLFRLG